ncbi:MAG TPA: hypothetical protein VF972_06610, partial [Actinomycetota bacterium]
MPRSRLLWIFTGALAGILAMSVIAILIRHPQAPAPNPCTPPGPCGNPPRGGPTPTPTSPPREPPPSDTSAPLLNGRI